MGSPRKVQDRKRGRKSDAERSARKHAYEREHVRERTRAYIGATAKGILSIMLAGGAIVTMAALPGLAVLMGMAIKGIEKRKKAYVQAMQQLEQANYVYPVRTMGDLHYELTKAGRWAASLETIKLPKCDTWDKRWRLVAFDIPEKKRKSRYALQIKIRDLGMYQVQRSLYAYPYECESEIRSVAEYFSVSGNILYLIVGRLGTRLESALIANFKLTRKHSQS